MNEEEERAYELGERAAWVRMLSVILMNLYGSEKLELQRLVLEREQAIATLRRVCTDHGDNDWNERLHLSDIIEKHLERHL